jgi:hypothetical protein
MMSALEHTAEGAPLIPADSLAAGVIRAEASVQRLRNIPSLRHAAAELIQTANSISCYNLVATNAAAEPLATAAALMSDGEIAVSDKNHLTVEKVLLIDAATVTGSVTRACAADLRARGAAWVGAVIYHRVRPDLDGLESEPLLDFVAALGDQ